MSAVKEITITVNGKQVKGKEGDTILDICRANGIDVPTLCHLKGLSNVGACRLCVVEIDGERRINPACTYPARDGLVVKTGTDKLEKYRRQILELIFTERNHFCFFCAASGDCELQALAYKYQMDHTRYAYAFPTLPTDALNRFLVLDHNRCIGCGRCVRMCSEVVGAATLDFGKRGWRTQVVADLNQPLGESSCISCGACSQACPTGAILSKASMYRGRTSEGKVVHSLCSLCGMGCDIDVLVKDNNIVRIDATNPTSPKGPLCYKGRFQQIFKEAARVVEPRIIDRKGTVGPASWDEALGLTATAIKAYVDRYGVNSVAGFVSSLCPNETLEAFSRVMHDTVGTNLVDTLDGSAYKAVTQGISAFSKDGKGLEVESPLEAILEAKCAMVVGADPLESHPAAGSYILRAVTQNQARLLVIDTEQNGLGSRADLWLRPNEGTVDEVISALASLATNKTKQGEEQWKAISAARVARTTGLNMALLVQAADMLSSAKDLVLVYGERAFDPKLIASLLELARTVSGDRLKAISLKPRGNSRGAWGTGVASGNNIAEAKLVYMLLADDDYRAHDWVQLARKAEFLIVQSSYASPLTEAADVLLPSPIWAERSGEYVSLDGKAGRSQRVLEPPAGIRDDVEIISQLAQRLQKERPKSWKK